MRIWKIFHYYLLREALKCLWDLYNRNTIGRKKYRSRLLYREGSNTVKYHFIEVLYCRDGIPIGPLSLGMYHRYFVGT